VLPAYLSFIQSSHQSARKFRRHKAHGVFYPTARSRQVFFNLFYSLFTIYLGSYDYFSLLLFLLTLLHR